LGAAPTEGGTGFAFIGDFIFLRFELLALAFAGALPFVAGDGEHIDPAPLQMNARFVCHVPSPAAKILANH
jgi:hypothetical protein